MGAKNYIHNLDNRNSNDQYLLNDYYIMVVVIVGYWLSLLNVFIVQVLSLELYSY